jgi:UDP-N-acetylmuramoyl-L-alanyl-D-glutamate--2,6-diaminopimelate ligase
MKLLRELLRDLKIQATFGPMHAAVAGISDNSRHVAKDYLFVAIKGTAFDGHQYIEAALAAGACAVVCEELPEAPQDHVAWIQVANAAEALGWLACNWYDRPSEKLQLVGITGTNGKTTTATLLYQLFGSLDRKSGLISTVVNCVGGKCEPSTHTTPNALVLQKLLAEMVDAGCKYAFMEVSSHGLVQHRVAGTRFAGAVFTNITHDHLDYHGTFDNYIRAKKLLFDGLKKDAFALVNADDKHGATMVLNTKARVHTFALRSPSDYKVKLLESHLTGLLITLNQKELWVRLIGAFNAYNVAAIYGVADLLSQDDELVRTALSSLTAPDGRFQTVQSATGILGVVDYAHTPDALENVLNTLAEFRHTAGAKVITVVGCGGDRDKSKRPVMAKIAAEKSDAVILTADNPRTEDPGQILREMEAGLDPVLIRKSTTLPDRKEAIKLAVQRAQPGDIVLVAGKGHETYQEIQGVRHPFDDRAVLLETFLMLNV